MLPKSETIKNLTNRQRKALRIVEYFVPSWINWDEIREWNLSLPLHKYMKNGKEFREPIVEDKNGVDAITAFFMVSERGNPPEKVTSKSELSRLLWGQRWVSTHIKMYKENSLCMPQDFLDEPEDIRELVFREVFGFEKDWKPKNG